MNNKKIAVLLVNLGSPDEPTPKEVRRYLRIFLGDKRVVRLPKILWFPILYGIILPIRSRKSAKKYETIWNKDGTNHGSPLIQITEKQAKKLQVNMDNSNLNTKVFFAMRYGKPSMKSVLDDIEKAGIDKLVVLPLYPQYSMTTTASVFDALADLLKDKVNVPEIHFIKEYFENELYLNILARKIDFWQEKYEIPERLIISYHGLPKSYVDAGDPYYNACIKTSEKIIERINFKKEHVITTFQSRLSDKWIKPYTDKTLEALALEGIKNIHIISPSFSSDCLETLEELAGECNDIFKEKGGETFRYISALNDDDEHIALMQQLVESYCK